MDVQRQELMLRALFEDSNDAFFVFHPETLRLVDVNSKAQQLTACQKEQLLGMRLTELFWPCNEAAGTESLTRAFDKGGFIRSRQDYRLAQRNGKPVPVQISAGRIQTEPHPLGLVVARDIPESRQEGEERACLAAAVNLANDAIVITDPSLRIQYVNPSFLEISGYEPEEVIGRHASALLKGDKSAHRLCMEAAVALQRGETWKGRVACRKSDGGLVEAHAAVSPVCEECGRVLHYVCVLRDVTHEAALESQLRQAAKMEAIGQLAGGIVHDFNNLLTAILGYSNLLKIGHQPGNRTFEAADIIETATRRAMDLTRQLLGFAREGKQQNKPVDLHGTIQEVIGLLSRTIPKNIAIKKRFRADSAVILGDPCQMEQMILNLAVNARDAMPHGGCLIFETERVSVDAGRLKPLADPAAGRHVRLAVRDTGCGIPAEIRERIFEPFFTTKSPGEGTGLGLSMVYEIVRAHGGLIEVQSEVGRGTTFQVCLPLAVEAQARKAA